MKELFRSPIELGATICLDDSLGAKIYENISKLENYPLRFEVKRKTVRGYVCEGVCSDSKNKKKIYLSNLVMNYVCGTTMENSNEKVPLCEFLPNENEKILIIKDDENCIIPACFKITVRFCEFNNIYYVDVAFENLLNQEHVNVDITGDSWKSLNTPEKYLDDTQKMYKDTFVHKEYVLDVCNKFADYLKEKGCFHEACELRNRATVHDNSKITDHDEFIALTSIVSDKSCLENASVPLSTLKQNSIKLHWKNNSHHPEHFENYEEMSTIDRMEMACDWMARSLQYKSNLLEFVKTRQEDRFHFSETMFTEVYNYCEILVSLYQI